MSIMSIAGRKKQTTWVLWLVGAGILLVLSLVGYGFYREAKINDEIITKVEESLKKRFVTFDGNAAAFINFSRVSVVEKGKELDNRQPVKVLVSGKVLRKYNNGATGIAECDAEVFIFDIHDDGFGHVGSVELKRN